MNPNKRIFATGTMRTGGTLLINALSLHSQISVFNERINYFRFVHNKYNPLNIKNIDRMLNQYKIRLKHRINVDVDVDEIFGRIIKSDLNQEACYEELMQSLLLPTGKKIWGEYANLSWKHIPDFLEMYPNGKVIHVCRDLRGVLASFGKISFMPNKLYLGAIFNWIDSVNHIIKYQNILSSKSYMMVRFEDIHLNPEDTIRSVCSFLNVPFEDSMTNDKDWHKLLNETHTKVNISSFTNKKVYGFDPSRNTTWKDNLHVWEIELCNYLAGDLLKKMGYEVSSSPFRNDTILETGLDYLRKQPYLSKLLEDFLSNGSGSDTLPIDPAKPENWSAPGDGFRKFTESTAYNRYIKDLEKLEVELANKYQ
jgi:hypothetical protein